MVLSSSSYRKSVALAGARPENNVSFNSSSPIDEALPYRLAARDLVPIAAIVAAPGRHGIARVFSA